MSSLRFNRLRICSEAEQAAAQFLLHPGKNLFWGGNGAGKSVILKSLFRAFDAEPSGEIPYWDYSAIVAVDFTVGSRDLTTVRQDGLRALFEGDRLLGAASDSLDWNRLLAANIGFGLRLLDRSGRFREAAPSTYFLPFFLSQDAFGSGWETFERLSQFQKTVEHTLEYFCGVRTPRYFELRANEQQIKAELDSYEVELATVKRTRVRLKKTLKVSPVRLNSRDFQVEIKQLINQTQELAKKQDALRHAIVEDQALERSLSEEVRLAASALKEHEADFKVAGELSTQNKTFVCPTCHAEHDSSFHTLLGLAEDARELFNLKRSIEATLSGVRSRLERNRRKAMELKTEYAELQQILEVRRGRFTFEDFIKSYSAGAADEQLATEEESIQKQVDRAAGLRKSIEAELKALKKEHDSSSILAKFRQHFAAAVAELSVEGLRKVEAWPLTRKPESSGSRYARGIGAYYIALWRTIESEGVLPAPVVIDSPNQGAQDRENLQAMLTFLAEKAPAGAQVLLSHERQPSEFTPALEFKMVKGERVLARDQFVPVGAQLMHLVQRARESLAMVRGEAHQVLPLDAE